jgi:hypothetical protein
MARDIVHPAIHRITAIMCVTLDTLELTSDELDHAKERVRHIAYLKWHDAGCPFNGSLEFWLEAERQWIEHEYAPHRDDTVLRR